MYKDKAYDNRNNFNILDNKINAESAIKIRKNAPVRSKGCPLRREEKRRDEVLLLIRKLGYDMMDGWKKDLKDAQVEELDS